MWVGGGGRRGEERQSSEGERALSQSCRALMAKVKTLTFTVGEARASRRVT